MSSLLQEPLPLAPNRSVQAGLVKARLVEARLVEAGLVEARLVEARSVEAEQIEDLPVLERFGFQRFDALEHASGQI